MLKEIIFISLLVLPSISGFCQEGTNDSLYAFNKAKADSVIKQDEEVREKCDTKELAILVKTTLDMACNLHISILNMISNLWQLSIENDADFSSYLIQFQNMGKSKGTNLRTEAIDQIIRSGVKDCVSKEELNEKISDKLLDYYSLYKEIYELSNSPTGSYISFNKKVNELSGESTRTANKLDIMLDVMTD